MSYAGNHVLVGVSRDELDIKNRQGFIVIVVRTLMSMCLGMMLALTTLIFSSVRCRV